MNIADMHEEMLKEWNTILDGIFDGNIPDNYEWTDLDQIVAILNRVGARENVNHSFFPNGGGLDLTSARLTELEHNCIEINFQSIIYLVKPQNLLFYSIGDNNLFSYFRLELDTMSPTGVYTSADVGYEEICVVDGQYYDRSVVDLGEIDGDILPENKKMLVRQWNGNILTFCKGSPYNQSVPSFDAYDEKYAKASRGDFYKFVTSLNSAYKNSISGEVV